MTDITETHVTSPAPSRSTKRIRWSQVFDHAILCTGAFFMLFPVLLVLMTTSFEDADIVRNGLQFGFEGQMLENFDAAMFEAAGFSKAITGTRMLINSLILGFGFAIGKIVISMMAAYAIVYFRLRFATFAFWIIFTTLLLPLEVRITVSPCGTYAHRRHPRNSLVSSAPRAQSIRSRSTAPVIGSLPVSATEPSGSGTSRLPRRQHDLRRCPPTRVASTTLSSPARVT